MQDEEVPFGIMEEIKWSDLWKQKCKQWDQPCFSGTGYVDNPGKYK